ncbi:helix-turn-helix transcriptional regulator [Niastella sp. OAS944]|uniref:helix-turn-helix transcriptional regulator n=1 Tax=Niastella sp. OAS944 TaxID=2664089 RepID=UPI00347BBE7C|nr:DNA-binding CsgD family transcriptional regulator [Chitinophagaceae bacterium OAS944]
MKPFLFLVALLSFICAGVKAQDADVAYLIKAWELADTSQTRKYLESVQYFYQQPDAVRKKLIEEMHAYVDKHANTRLQVRLMLLEEPWWAVCMDADPGGEAGIPLIKKAVQLANQENDDQLLSEVYSAYAEHSTRIAWVEDYLFYSIKALELQQRLGAEHFPNINTRWFDMCKALYVTREYRLSLEYGQKALSVKTNDVFTLDLIGASYKKLGLYDSSLYYYNKLADILKPDAGGAVDGFKEKWLIIAKGNIGENLPLQKKYDLALPMLKEYALKSGEVVDAFNVALANNALANLYFAQHQFALALGCWKITYAWANSKEVNNMEYATKAAEGIAAAYSGLGRIDSAFFYSTLFHRHSDSLNAFTSRSNLRATKAKITFEEMQTGLQSARAANRQQRLIMYFIVGGIILFAIIALLLYNRKLWRQKYKTAILERKRQVAEMESKRAKEQIALFTQQIIDKNNLIDKLTEELAIQTENAVTEKNTAVESLLQYTLLTDGEWEKFRMEFYRAYPDFFPAFKKLVAQPTPAEERLATLIYLDLSNQQIANTLGISKDSVTRGKRRLKQRLNLQTDEVLEAYIRNLNN